MVPACYAKSDIQDCMRKLITSYEIEKNHNQMWEKVVKPPQKPTIQNAFKVSPHSMLSSKRAKIPIKKPPDIFIERMTQGTAFRKHNEIKT